MDIEQFQKRLDSDQALRRSFAKNPVAALREKGIKLPPEAEEELTAAVQQGALEKPGAQVLLGIKIKF
ncbi:hypothetical protein [Pelagibius sp. Alg239-R121]|uniref:hypothetical protein n=1 Tax=Pelagibius sp. Alg239-R121 TaxID=2993448 RepID=UPI0024A6A180|nr:hypothetical protein [Pelagibius sp. Alg239-R121]